MATTYSFDPESMTAEQWKQYYESMPDIGGLKEDAYAQYQAALAREQKEKQEQEALERKRLLDVSAARERKRTVREAAIKQAQVQAGAAERGITGTTVATGAEASLFTQLGSNLAFQEQQRTSAGTIFGLGQEISDIQFESGMAAREFEQSQRDKESRRQALMQLLSVGSTIFG